MQWTTINSKNVDGLTFVGAFFPLNRPDALLIEDLNLPYLIEYIQKKEIKKAYIQCMGNFDFLRSCPTLEYITIELTLPFSEYKNCELKRDKIYKQYDFEPVLSLPHLKGLTIINNEHPDIKSKIRFDISRFKELQKYDGDSENIINLGKAHSLKTLVLRSKYKREDLYELRELKQIDTLEFSFSKVFSLNGIEALPRLQCLYINYNRSLSDIRALSGVKGTLKALRIENCPKIEDFSVLGELENLELLELSGSNVLPNLDFLKTMKNLKTFVFNMNVLDGDLTPCLNLSYVYSEINRRHFNLKDEELPKGNYIRGNEDIEEWRRLE